MKNQNYFLQLNNYFFLFLHTPRARVCTLFRQMYTPRPSALGRKYFPTVSAVRFLFAAAFFSHCSTDDAAMPVQHVRTTPLNVILAAERRARRSNAHDSWTWWRWCGAWAALQRWWRVPWRNDPTRRHFCASSGSTSPPGSASRPPGATPAAWCACDPMFIPTVWCCTASPSAQ